MKKKKTVLKRITESKPFLDEWAERILETTAPELLPEKEPEEEEKTK